MQGTPTSRKSGSNAPYPARPSWPTLSDSLIRSTWTRFSVHTGEPKRQILRPHRQSLLLLPAHDLALSVQYSGGREITENGVLKLGIPDTKFDQVADADEPWNIVPGGDQQMSCPEA